MKRLSVIVLMIGFLAGSAPLFAHHGTASYDSDKTFTVTGTVTDYIWSNPHVLLKVDAKDDSGNMQHWVIEAQNPVTQMSHGWTKNTFKQGDEVTLDVTPARNNQPVGIFKGRIVINGKPLSCPASSQNCLGY
jgi:hypothetical protein